MVTVSAPSSSSRRHTMRLFLSVLVALVIGTMVVHAAPISDKSGAGVVSAEARIVQQEYLNQILSTDSDEDVYFGRTWSDLLDAAQQDLKAALMMVSSSSDDHIVEMTILARTKQQMDAAEDGSFHPDDDDHNNDEDDLDFWSDT